MALRNVFITGVHSGLGNALAQQYLDLGYRVYGISRNKPTNIEHDKFIFFSLDLTDFNKVDKSLSHLLKDVNVLDIVYLNAGVLGEIKDLSQTTIDELRSVMDINVWANKVVLDSLFLKSISISQVVAISSGASVNGSGGWGGYSISKSALNLLIRVYANEVQGTHFTALAPGVIETNMTRTIFSSPTNERYDADRRIKDAFKEKRLLAPLDAAKNIIKNTHLFATKPSGSYIDIRKL